MLGNITFFPLISALQVLSFCPSEHSNVDKNEVQLTGSEKAQFTSFLSEKELGFINILYGRYYIADYDPCFL